VATVGRLWGERNRPSPKVTVQFSNYSNIFKRLEWIQSKRDPSRA
jgi:hypothetical protein